MCIDEEAETTNGNGQMMGVAARSIRDRFYKPMRCRAHMVQCSRRFSFAFLSIALSVFAVTVSSQTSTRRNPEPASEGMPITPAGSLVFDGEAGRPSVGALPVKFVRSPDNAAADGKGRYLLAINSGYGIQFSAATNRAQQSISIIDLNAKPAPVVTQNVYFPTPQSVNVGLVFSTEPESDGAYMLYASGGFENKIWIFRFYPGARLPVTPASSGQESKVEAPYIDVSGFAVVPATPRYNRNQKTVYPTGLALSADGKSLFVANNLDDSLGIVGNLRGTTKLTRVSLRRGKSNRMVYPYEAVTISASGAASGNFPPTTKVYVSCWNDDSLAVVQIGRTQSVSYLPVGRHPTAMVEDAKRGRLYVVNSDGDSVSVIDTASDREVERIDVRLAENWRPGASPESLALNSDGTTLFVSNAHSNAVAVVRLSNGMASDSRPNKQSRVAGFIPTGQYPSAIAFANGIIFVGNGKGTGFENSSIVANNSGREPNLPNEHFPGKTGRAGGLGGQYSMSLVSGNISAIQEPDDRTLAGYTQQVMRNDGLLGENRRALFPGKSPIKHVIYLIKENRTYDEVLGDIVVSGDGSHADGDASIAIFGAGKAAQPPGVSNQNITPNQHALALRFGLLDRFFCNSEASADGHNWSTAAFSNDYVDKTFRWDYSGRGRSYDYEGFNRLPNLDPVKDAAPAFALPVTAEKIARYEQLFIPYLNGSRDIGEPGTLYIWDAAARAGLSYRSYGEFVGTFSEADVAAVNANRPKSYPDLSPTASALPTKKSLEGHNSSTYRNFDLYTPDAMSVQSYQLARSHPARAGDPLIIRANQNEKLRGYSRTGDWLEEFQRYVSDLEAGKQDRLPNISIFRMPNDHTDGMTAGMPTPQFYVADNDYAVGKLVESVSSSPYWKDTAIFIVEDDAQDGPDHVDTHRSVALVISAYNRPGTLVHAFHNTVSLIRTMELLLGMGPMNQLDAVASPIDIFHGEPDMHSYRAIVPNVAPGNLITERPANKTTAYWMEQSGELDMSHADMSDATRLNQIIWFSVRRNTSLIPKLASLPAFDAMQSGMKEEKQELADAGKAGRPER